MNSMTKMFEIQTIIGINRGSEEKKNQIPIHLEAGTMLEEGKVRI